MGETLTLSSVGVFGALVYSLLSFSSKREKFYIGTVVIVETGVICGMQLFVKSNASAVKNGGNRTTIGCDRQLPKKKTK